MNDVANLAIVKFDATVGTRIILSKFDIDATVHPFHLKF